jgi:hypothetical protein
MGHADRGGHFAGWEHPELFAAELRAAFNHCGRCSVRDGPCARAARRRRQSQEDL